MKPKISIIIPIYNVEMYLPRCIDSVLSQSFSNFELILINDGSTDQSGDICDKYAARDNRIIVIHTPNSGVSAARNRGLDMAKGEYIGFVDPDDYIDSRMYEILINKVEELNVDIAICSFAYVENHKVTPHDISEECKLFNKEQAIEYYFNEKLPFDYSFLCNKLFHKKLFVSVRLNPILSVQEDNEVFIRLLNQSASVIYIPKPLYFYYIRMDSVTQSGLTFKKLTVVDSLFEVYKYTHEKLPHFQNEALNKYLLYYFNQVVEIVRAGQMFNNEYFIFRKKLYKNYFPIIFNTSVSLKYKIHSTMYIFMPSIYKIYLKNRIILESKG